MVEGSALSATHTGPNGNFLSLIYLCSSAHRLLCCGQARDTAVYFTMSVGYFSAKIALTDTPFGQMFLCVSVQPRQA